MKQKLDYLANQFKCFVSVKKYLSKFQRKKYIVIQQIEKCMYFSLFHFDRYFHIQVLVNVK